jgi:tRNA dimethylallyltransferase
MLDGGFLDEVQRLRERPGVHADLPAMRAVGYRQALAALDAGLSGDALRNLVRERGIAATRQLAKRQLTWLRSMPHRQRVVCDAPDVIEQSLRIVSEHWKPA